MSNTEIFQLSNLESEAFFDNFNEITIKAPKNYYSINDTFTLINIDTKKQIENIPILNIDINGKYSYLHLLIESHFIKFNYYYKIIDNQKNEFGVKIGKIITQNAFDVMYFYDGDDLGNTYSQEKTIFKVWSPYSYHIRLKLKENFYSLPIYFDMKRKEKGIWELVVEKNLENYLYRYEVHNNFTVNETIDPYAVSSSSNSKYSYIIDLKNLKKYDKPYKSKIKNNVDHIIYEISIRDFTDSSKFKDPGKFLALTQKGIKGDNKNPLGLDYILDLGINTVQIMPMYDFATIDESSDTVNQYNWGYDPIQWNVPEGSYSTNPYDPYARLIELKQMINTFHEHDIKVVMDVVFNHVYDVFSYSWHILNPNYFFRYTENIALSNASGTGNDVATERWMVRKYITDVLKHWQKTFNIDGLRFDLMGLIDVETILKIDKAMKKNNENFIIYGEGWNMNHTATSSILANMENSRFLPNIGFFNDYFRDIFKGNQWNIFSKPFSAGDWQQGHKALNAIMGSIGLYEYTSKFKSHIQSINYVECHDNYTLFDFLKIILNSFSNTKIKLIHLFSTAIVLLSQGVPFLHSGQEFFRTKNGVENSYNSPIEINRFDWKQVYENKWSINIVKKLIEIRKKYDLFRLNSIEDIKNKTKIFVDQNSLVKYELEDENYFIKVLMNINEHPINLFLDFKYWKFLVSNQKDQNILIENNITKINPNGIYVFAWHKKEGNNDKN